MSSQKHIIKKLVIDLTLPRKDDAFKIQESVKEIYYSKLLKMLDKSFSKICEEDEYLFIDKIEIDLDRIYLRNLEENLVERFKAYFHRNLVEKIKQNRLESIEDFVTPEGNPFKHAAFPLEKKEKLRKSFTEVEYHFELIKHFIMIGALPWWAELKEKSISDIFITVLEAKDIDIREFILEVIQKPEALKRLIYQFDEAAVKKLITILFRNDSSIIQIWKAGLISLSKKVSLLKPLGVRIEKEINISIIASFKEKAAEDTLEFRLIHKFLEIVLREDKIETLQLVKQMIQKLKEQKKWRFYSQMLKILMDVEKIFSIEGEKQEKAEKVIEFVEKKDREETQLAQKAAEIKEEEGKSDSQTLNRDEFKKKIDEVSAEQKEGYLGEKEEEKRQLNIYNAGLVLVGSYLKLFFTKLGLIKDDCFKHTDSQIKAVHLLQYLVTREEENPEYMLPLNKILCGLDVSYPVSLDVNLLESEKEECEELLRSIIKHWSALKSTSVEGFRNSFLIRDGIIELNDSNTLLRVERKAYDLLLDKLPWSISIIRLSWMKTNLYVEW